MRHKAMRPFIALAATPAPRVMLGAVCAALCAFFLAACDLPGTVKPTVKIGLSAPFEGLDRDLGYEALYAVTLAVRERNADGGVGGRYLVELVALNDFNEAGKATEQARKMAADPDLLGALGGWSRETQGVASEYERLGLAFLASELDIIHSGPAVVVGADFAARYAKQSGGAAPTPAASWAYSAANLLMDAIDDASALVDGRLTRSAVRVAVDSLGQ